LLAAQRAPDGGAPTIVTPEAVPIGFELGGVGSRSLSFLIDALAQFTLLLAAQFGATLLVAGTGLGLPGWAAVTAFVLLVFTIFWGYPVAFESLWRGRTPGKAAMGLRVVTTEGAPVRFRHAAIRAALGLIDFWATLGAVAVVSALVTRRHQRLGDLVAGTIVLRERTGTPRPTAVRFRTPEGAEAYAATLDPAALTGEDYTALRSFLLRAPSLAPPVRAGLARQLAQPLAARIRHTPPPEVSPELFLACLAARYQQRGVPGGTERPAGEPASEPPPTPPGDFAPPG
jgi:uncharacterized RDD family membrane protein YckC